MIEQPIDDPRPDNAAFVITDGDVAKIYFADDAEAIVFIENQLLCIKSEAKGFVSNQCGEEILKGVDSNAVGIVKHYRTSRDDQANITSAVSANKGSTVTQDNIKVILNIGQTIILNFDIADRRESLFTEKERRKVEIDVALTEESITEIINRGWS